jgi:hypothetical protein
VGRNSGGPKFRLAEIRVGRNPSGLNILT